MQLSSNPKPDRAKEVEGADLQVLDSEVTEGRWSKQEHELFLIGMMKFGKDWKQVEKVVKSRNGSQVRSHAQKYFIKLHKIQKQRKKQKPKIPNEPTEIESEVVSMFTEDDITEKTPNEFILLIRNLETSLPGFHVGSSIKRLNTKNLVHRLRKEGEALRNKIEDRCSHASADMVAEKSEQIEELRRKHTEIVGAKNFIEVFDHFGEENEQEQDESYLISIMKSHVDMLRNGFMFENLIDFGSNAHELRKTVGNAEDSSSEQLQSQSRKKSFGLLDDCDDQEQLEWTLEKVRKGE